MPPVAVDLWLQYGSFGLVALIVVWVGYSVIPGALRSHRETLQSVVASFCEESQRRDARCDAEHERRDAQFDRQTAAIDALAKEVRKLGERSRGDG